MHGAHTHRGVPDAAVHASSHYTTRLPHSCRAAAAMVRLCRASSMHSAATCPTLTCSQDCTRWVMFPRTHHVPHGIVYMDVGIGRPFRTEAVLGVRPARCGEFQMLPSRTASLRLQRSFNQCASDEYQRGWSNIANVLIGRRRLGQQDCRPAKLGQQATRFGRWLVSLTGPSPIRIINYVGYNN